MYKPTSHYLLFDFKVVPGSDINKLSDRVEIKTLERNEQLDLSKQTGFR